MTPQEIADVVATWQSVAPRRAELLEHVAANLPASELWPPRERAAWILEAVDRSAGCFGQPTALADVATAMAAGHRARGVAALREDGEALVLGLQLAGARGGESPVAWRRAWQLLGELVASVTLRPFGTGDPPLAPAT
jgi:hypothetical protein